MNLSLGTTVSAFTVFLQGILSFLSPCIFPLVPLYIGYLASGAKTVKEDGSIYYKRGRVMLHTICFVVGVSFAFFLLGFGFTALGTFFTNNRVWFARIGGIIIILFGLIQLIGSPWKKEHRFSFQLNRYTMNPLTAFLFGFTFSFAWTPCVGPVLTSVLLMASSAQSSATGFLLIGVYTLGFILPFLALGLFTSQLLAFFKKRQAIVRYTVKIGAVLMILMGVLMVTGMMNGINVYLSRLSQTTNQTQQNLDSTENTVDVTPEQIETQNETSQESNTVPAPDFTLSDQFGNTHTLSEYKGKVVFLNFWTTWCGYCKEEMPDIQQLYEEYGQNQGDLVVLGVANPRSELFPNGADVEKSEIIQFLTDAGYTYPTVMDTTGSVFREYGISSFPFTLMIDRDGNVFGYVGGMLTKEQMEQIVQQTMAGTVTN